jgi:glycosyltransferase involved in cell wall biosynthesis
MATAVLDLELTDFVGDRAGMHRYSRALALLRYHGRPIGAVEVPVIDGRIDGGALRQAIAAGAGDRLWRERVREWAAGEGDEEGDRGARSPTGMLPRATVAVCTRDRPADLRRCLEGLMELPDDGQEIIVIDNAPSTEATRELAGEYPRLRYVLERAPGLDRARNRALREATGEIVAFLDDDSVPDRGWLRALLRGFDDPLVMSVTGLTMPLELETEAQEWFERMSSFNRGFERRWFDLTNHDPLATGRVGAGVNMALRRDALERVGPFEESLDAGTPTKSGGDHEMLARILRLGFRVVYEPDALNWHRHRRGWAEVRAALRGYGTGVYALLTHQVVEWREMGAIRLAWLWFRDTQAPTLVRSLLRRPGAPPTDLVIAELLGCYAGPWAYLRSRRLRGAEDG